MKKHYLSKYKVTVTSWNHGLQSEFYANTMAQVNQTIKADFKRHTGEKEWFKQHCIMKIQKADKAQFDSVVNDSTWIPYCNRIYHNFKFKNYDSLAIKTEY